MKSPKLHAGRLEVTILLLALVGCVPLNGLAPDGGSGAKAGAGGQSAGASGAGGLAAAGSGGAGGTKVDGGAGSAAGAQGIAGSGSTLGVAGTGIAGAGAGGAGTGGAGTGIAGASGGVAGTGVAGTAGAGGGVAGAGVGGTGGAQGAAGAGGVQGAAGTGGAGGTGAAGATGTGGTGGTPAACQLNTTQCMGNRVQTCGSDLQWGAAQPCGAHQTCTGPVGQGHCSCNVDPACTSAGGRCMSSSSLVSCAQDAQSCFYTSATSTCNDGACTGSAGGAMCCVNSCTVGAVTTCATGTAIGACVSDVGNGCHGLSPSACGTGLVCKRYAPATCVDADWAEWPMPNVQADVTTGAPHLSSLTDNHDGTVTDNVTGLVWQQTVSGGTFTFDQATRGCVALTLGGHTDWRVPSMIELVSIIDYGRVVAPALDQTAFPGGLTNAGFWSSTVGVLAGDHRTVDFSAGQAGGELGATALTSVRCVR